MNPKNSLRITIALLVTSFSLATFAAAPKDAAATKKIDEAINVHYLATEFDKAEAQLLGIIKACGKDCSPSVIAKAYMYVGLVRGSGKQNLPAAREAFEKAKASDPGVALDAALATPEVQAEFSKVKGGGGAASPSPAPAAATAPPETAAAAGFSCTPAEGYEIQVRQPIPVSCTVPAGVAKGELSYKAADAATFTTVPMIVQGGTLRGQIPCDGVSTAGALNFYVIAQDSTGDTIDTVGTAEAPSSYNIVAESSQPAPAYPGSAPPARCGTVSATAKGECPPGFPGCSGGGGWGESCTPAAPCKEGLYCAAGTCENAPSCETNSDCDSGVCNEGFCQMPEAASHAKYRKLKIGIHFAPDFWVTTKDQDVCGYSSNIDGKYACYPTGQSQFNPDTDKMPLGANGYAGTVGSGVALATLRVLLSMDYAFTPNFTLGGRAGYSFNGGPASIKYNSGIPSAGAKYLPIHLEARASFWIRPLSLPGVHPYVHIGGGMAQVDGKVKVTAYKCLDHSQATCDAYESATYQYDAWRKMGQGFATAGGGAIFPIGANGGIQANLNIMYMLPATGIVLEPSLGYVLGI